MERLTTNKPVDEMSMLELAYNSCYVKDEKAMYEDFETVRDARDFARNLYKSYLGEELPEDDEEFDGRMLDDLQYEAEVHLRGLIALFYRNLWAMADLREKLKAYEDKEEQGLLIELPVTIGSDVFCIPSRVNYVLNEPLYQLNGLKVRHRKITSLHFTGNTWYAESEISHRCGLVESMLLEGTFKETWFATESEAREALEKYRGK